MFALHDQLAVLPHLTDREFFIPRLPQVARGGRKAQDIPTANGNFPPAEQLHITGNEFFRGQQGQLALFISHRNKVAVPVDTDHVLVVVAPLNHHPGFPGFRFIKLMAGMPDVLQNGYGHRAVAQLSPFRESLPDSLIHRLTVAVQLCNDQRSCPDLGGSPQPVGRNIVYRRFRLLNGTARRYRAGFTGNLVRADRRNPADRRVHAVINDVVNRIFQLQLFLAHNLLHDHHIQRATLLNQPERRTGIDRFKLVFIPHDHGPTATILDRLIERGRVLVAAHRGLIDKKHSPLIVRLITGRDTLIMLDNE